MKPLKVGDRVTMPTVKYLSDGVVTEVFTASQNPRVFGYGITLDAEAPDESAYYGYDVFMPPWLVELVK